MVDQGNNGDQTIPDFGGHSLQSVPGLQSHHVEALQRYGLQDAEQVAALSLVPGAMEHFKQGTGLSQEEVNDLLSKVNEIAPIAAAGGAEVPEFALGALPPTPEMEAFAAAAAEQPMIAAALPPSVNHIALMPQPKQQGARGTCVSFAMTAVHEFHRRANSEPVEDLSEQFLY